MIVYKFATATLAVWRLSRAIAWERGPTDIFARTRQAVAQRWPYAPAEAANYLCPDDYDQNGKAESWQRAGIKCPLCISFWLGIVMAVAMLPKGRVRALVDTLALGVALAGGAAWLNKLEKRLNGY